MKNRPELHKGFTLLEVVIAIIIVSAISVAAVSSILALRSLSNGYYQRLLAFNQLDNVSTCVELAEGDDPVLGIPDRLELLYGDGWESGSLFPNPNGDGWRIYYDAGFRPVDSASAEFYLDIDVDRNEYQRVMLCEVQKGSDPEPALSLSGLDAGADARTVTQYTVLETLQRDAEGNETLTWTIGGESIRVREETALYADAQHDYAVHRVADGHAEAPTEDLSELSPERTRALLSRSIGLDGSLQGDVLLTRKIAAYRLRICKIDPKKPDDPKVIAESDQVIRRTYEELDEYGRPYAHQGVGLSDGLALGFSGGNGSAEHPFLIGSAAELRAMEKLSEEMRPVDTAGSFIVLDRQSGSLYLYGTALSCDFVTDAGYYRLRRADSPDELLRIGADADGVLTVRLPDGVSPTALAETGVRLFVIPASGANAISLPDDLPRETAASLTDAECRMLRRSYYHFRLTASIDLADSEGTICTNFCGSFDGDGYQITGGSRDVCLFGTLSADSVVRGLDLVQSGSGLLSVAESSGCVRSAVQRIELRVVVQTDEEGNIEYGMTDPHGPYALGDAVLLENISVYGALRTGDAEGPYVRNALGRRTTFRGCTNYADMISDAAEGCAIYVAARWDISADLVFEDCKNFGTVFGDHAALFVACAERGSAPGTVGVMSVMNSCSFGRIVGRKTAGYVYGCEDDFAFEALFGSYTRPGAGGAVASVAPTLLSALSDLRSITEGETPGALQCTVPSTGLQTALLQMRGDYHDARGEQKTLMIWQEQGVNKPEPEEGEEEPADYTARLSAVRFLDEASAADFDAEQEELPGLAGRDVRSGVTYRVYTAVWTEKTEPAAPGDPPEETERTERWYVFALEEGVTVDLLADLTLLTLGEDGLGLGSRVGGTTIGYGIRVLSFAV